MSRLSIVSDFWSLLSALTFLPAPPVSLLGLFFSGLLWPSGGLWDPGCRPLACFCPVHASRRQGGCAGWRAPGAELSVLGLCTQVQPRRGCERCGLLKTLKVSCQHLKIGDFTQTRGFFAPRLPLPEGPAPGPSPCAQRSLPTCSQLAWGRGTLFSQLGPRGGIHVWRCTFREKHEMCSLVHMDTGPESKETRF